MNRQRKLKLLKLKKQARKQHAPKNPETAEQIQTKRDERFESVSYDPRFARVPKQIQKVKIDKRFNRMMTDDRFKLVTNVDKYGRKIATSKQNKELKELYYGDEEMQSEQQHQPEQSQEEQQEQPKQKPKGHDMGLREWMENYDEQSDESSSYSNPQSEEALEEVWEDDKNVVKNDKVPATRRLALCNYQWTNISAKDLMVLFNSFKPAAGFIRSVTVYPSELGLQKLKEEEMHGPTSIWNEAAQEAPTRPAKQRSLQSILKNQPEETDECIDPDKLRAYEKERLRYYYAVIECDSKDTADEIYKTCDSHQLENSGQLDLRFVPDELEFPHEPSDFCDELPSKSEIKQTINRAVGHTKVSLTWEDPELNTIAGLKKKNWGKMTEKEMEQVDWSLYMNDDGMSEQDNKHKQDQEEISNHAEQDHSLPDWKKQYHNKSKRKQSSSSEQMEVTFNAGFDLADRIKQKKEEGKLSSFELFQKRKKQKKLERNAEKQQRKRKQQEVEEEEQRDGKSLCNSEQKQRQQLELLVDKQHKRQDFKPDVTDDRFTSVYNNPLYAIDPTSHHFKVTKNTKLLGEVVRRKRNTAQ